MPNFREFQRISTTRPITFNQNICRLVNRQRALQCLRHRENINSALDPQLLLLLLYRTYIEPDPGRTSYLRGYHQFTTTKM